MVNSQVIADIENNLKLDRNVDKIPPVNAIVDVSLRNKPIHIIESAYATNAASTTIYTTPATQDFYLTFATLQMKASSGVANTPAMQLTLVINGQRKALLQCINIANLGTVTGPVDTFISGNNIIKVDRGTTITLVMIAPSANDMISGTIAGFIDEIN